jgi:hypothetical protein
MLNTLSGSSILSRCSAVALPTLLRPNSWSSREATNIPEDVWYAWLNDTWTKIPPEKIVKDYAPDDQAHLFMLAGTNQCFVRPKGGL